MELGAKRKEGAPTALRLTLWFGVSIVFALGYLTRTPIEIAPEPIPRKAFEIERSHDSDVALVLDYAAIRAPEKTFRQRDWSAVWIDTLEQELGPVAVYTPEILSADSLAKTRMLVLSHSVAANFPDGLIGEIRRRVADGMVLIIDRPTGKLRETFAANGRGGKRKASFVTKADGLDPGLFGPLSLIDLQTTVIGSTTSRPGSTTRFSIDGIPAIYDLKIGSGIVSVIEFDFPGLIMAAQQGRPSDDYVLRSKTKVRTSPKTEDLVPENIQLPLSIPYADLIERVVLWGLIGDESPIAGIWPFPSGRDGAVVSIFPDDSLGDEAFWISKKGTFQFTFESPIEPDDVSKRDIGFSWYVEQSPDARFERLGVGSWKPLLRAQTIDAQFKKVSELSSNGRIYSSMSWGGWWTPEFDDAFHDLTRHQIRIDTSYSVAKTSGYAFGTGFPFLVYASDGSPIGLREMPIVFPENQERGPRLSQLLIESAGGLHQVISLRQPPLQFAQRPNSKVFSEWMEDYAQIDALNHEHWSIVALDSFQRARRATGLRTRVIGESVVPFLPSAPDDEQQETATTTAWLYRITIDAKRTDLSIVVPNTLGKRTVIDVREKSSKEKGRLVARARDSDIVNLSGFELRRIPVPRGFSTVEVFYAEEKTDL